MRLREQAHPFSMKKGFLFSESYSDGEEQRSKACRAVRIAAFGANLSQKGVHLAESNFRTGSGEK